MLDATTPHLESRSWPDSPSAIARSEPPWSQALASWIDEERQARFILEPSRQILWLSLAARELIEAGAAFRVDEGRLSSVDPKVQATITCLLQHASHTHPICGLTESGPGNRWVLWARRITGSEDELTGLSVRRCRSTQEFSALAKTHELTRAEERVIEMMLAGAETGSIAQALDISPETVRTHVKHAYRKLGVSSRGELFAEAIDYAKP